MPETRDRLDAVEEVMQERESLALEGSTLLARFQHLDRLYYDSANRGAEAARIYPTWRGARREYREWLTKLIERAYPVSAADEEDVNAREAERQSQFKLRAP